MMLSSSRSDRTAIAATVAIAVGVATYTVIHLSSKNSKQGKRRPAPPSAPDGVIKCLQALGDPYGVVPAILRWARVLNFPSAMRVPMIPNRTVVLLSDPELIREIFTDKLTKKPAAIYQCASTVRGMSMGAEIDDVKWRHARKGVAPAFSSQNIQRLHQVCDTNVGRWIREFLDPLAQRGEAFDPCEGVLSLTVAVIFEAAMDYLASEQEIEDYLGDVTAISVETFKRLIIPGRSWLKSLLPGAKRADEGMERTMKLMFKLLEKHRSSRDPVRGTVLDYVDKNPNYQDDAARARDLDIFLWAGFDTTGYTICWILYELAKRPEEMERLRSVLLNTPEDKRTACPDLQNVVKECIRLNYTPVLGGSRELGRDFDTSDGYTLLKGTIAFQSNLANFNPKVYGDDADTFRPDRWNEEDDDSMKSALIPFSVGPRDCVGQKLATAEIHSVVAAIVTRYRLEVVEDCRPEFFITHRPSNGKIRAIPI